MAKNLNVNLTFNAQTGQAKAQIQELQTLLNKIAYAGNTTIDVKAGNIREAAAAAKELQYHLNNAYNATTGNFDLSRLDKSLKSAQTNIGELSGKLLQAGQTGQQAFMSLAQSIAKADQPMLRLGNRMNEFMTTLKNTARWQISSSILHGFMGTIQSAYGYAQDLNESLNNIRIVTGQSTEQMAQFADQANKAAKALSTTTTEYTNASLIYYQQGLDDSQVKERTDATIKMANVSRQSAETVSDQMTAIWNNFDDGSKSLEYYGDVITELGAKTASSSQEIAAGLEKFAAVSETIGLSYEYATSALATVTATTRQSADVVGTAFKTIFTRLQGLSLGETLEDGVNLNKYSEALAKVGVNAIDANGNLIEMDNILDQLGERWDDLSKAEQTALAQTVAGVRQYTQLVALMDNWDFFGENLAAAYDAEGTLDEQAEIYAESWEAASDRVRAAAEGIYQNLLDDDFFIGVNNGFAEMLGGIGEFIQGIGGMKGVIVAISSLILTNFANKIPDAINNLKVNFTYLTKGAGEAYQKLQSEFRETSEKAFKKELIDRDSSLGYAVESANDLALAKTKLSMASNKLSNSEKALANMEIDLMSSLRDETILLKQRNEELQRSFDLYASEDFLSEKNLGKNALKRISPIEEEGFASTPPGFDSWEENYVDLYKAAALEIQNSFSGLGSAITSELSQAAKAGKDLSNVSIDITSHLSGIKSVMSNMKGTDLLNLSLEDARTALLNLKDLLPPSVANLESFKSIFSEIKTTNDLQQMPALFDRLSNALNEVKIDGKVAKDVLKDILSPSQFNDFIGKLNEYQSNAIKAADGQARLNAQVNNFNPEHLIKGSEALASFGAMLGNLSMGISSISNIFSTLSDPDISGFEKLTSSLMSISMIIPSVSSGIKNWHKITDFASAAAANLSRANDLANFSFLNQSQAIGKAVASLSAEKAASLSSASATLLEAAANDKLTDEELEEIGAEVASQMTKILGITIDTDQAIAIAAVTGANKLETASWYDKIKAVLAYNVVGGLSVGVILGIVAAIALIAIAVSHFVVTQKEATEAMAESLDAYKEAEDELKSLQDELKNTNDRIKELESQESLSLIEQEELSELQQASAELERQIALKEKLANVAKAQVAGDFVKNEKHLDDWVSNRPSELLDSDNAGIWDVGMGTYEQQLESIEKLFAEGKINQNQKDRSIQRLNERKAKYDSEYGKWLSENEESYQAYLEGFEAFYDLHKDDENYVDQINQYAQTIEKMNRAMSQGDYEKVYLDTMSPMFEQSEKDVGTDIMGEIFGAADGEIPEAVDLANKFSDTFKDQLYKAGILPEDYAQYLIDKAGEIEDGIQETFTDEDGAVSDTFNQMKDQLSSEDWEILPHLELTGKETFDEVVDMIEEYKNSEINVDVNTTTKEDFSTIYKVTKGLKQGDSLDPDTYNDLIGRLGDGFEDFFDMTAEGEYQLTAKAEEFQAAVEKIQLENIFSQIEDNIEQIEENAKKKVYGDNYISAWGDLDSFGTGSFSKAEDGTIQVDQRKASLQGAFVQAMGMADGIVFDPFGNVVQTEENLQALTIATEAAIVAYQGLDAANQALVNDSAQLEGMLASSAQTLDQLAQYVEVGSEAYNTFFDTVFEREAEAEGFNVDELTAYADTLKDVNAATIESEQEAKKLALAHARMNRGIQNLTDNWDDWSKALKSDDLTKKSKAIAGLRDVMSDLTGADMSKLSAGFFENTTNAENLKKAIEGDAEAIDALTAAATKDLIIQMDLDSSTTSQLQSLVDQTLNAIDVKDLEVGASLEATGMYSAFQQMLDSGAVTVAQMNEILSGIGFTPDVTMKRIPIDNAVASSDGNTYTVEYLDTEGNVQTKTITSQQYNDAQSVGYIEIPVINGDTTSYTGGGGSINKQTSNPGGGGGSSKPREHRKTESSDRYKEVEDKLDNINELMQDYNRELDAAYGAGRIAAGKKIVDNLEAEIIALKEKITLAKKYQEIDAQALKDTLAGKDPDKLDSVEDFGLLETLHIDSEFNITNWDEFWNHANEVYNKMVDDYNAMADGAAKDALGEQLDAFEEWLDDVREAADQLDETTETLEDATQAAKDAILEKMEQIYDNWEEGLKLQEDINDDFIHELERTLKYFSDDFFARAEKMAIMSQVTGIYDTADANEATGRFAELEALYAAGKITQADFIEGTRAIQDYAENAIDELYSFKEEMSVYYKETVEESLDILNGVLDQFDVMQNVLDHYANIYEIINGTVDYDTQLEIMEAQKESLYQQAKSAEAAYEMYKSQIATEEAQFKDAQAAMEYARANYDPTSEQYQNAYDSWVEAKNSYEAILTAAQESRETLLATAEEYAQLLRDIFTTEMEKYSKDLEKGLLSTLDGVHSFDQLNEQIEYAKSLTEDWLTTTNKIYETNKLINTAQTDIDKTSNIVAKNKLKAFIEETEQLQNQTKLSNFELEVQQAKYNLLLAEIALEEAKNAKSVVRMQRDSEGNYGYVYTADQDAVGEAEQAYADADNDLYNIRLEGANEFAEKRLQLEQDLHDKLTELNRLYYEEGAISEEEYHARKEALITNYSEKVQEYSRIYNEAIREDARVSQDAWSTEFGEMITDTDTWKTEVTTYLGNVQSSWTTFQEEVTRLNGLIDDSSEETGKTLKEILQTEIDNTRIKSKELGDYITTTLVPAIQSEIEKVGEAAEVYRTKLIPEINNAIAAYQTLVAAATAARQAAYQDSGEIPDPDDTGGDDTGGDTPDDADGDTPGGDTPVGPPGKKEYKAEIYDLGGHVVWSKSGFYSSEAAEAAAIAQKAEATTKIQVSNTATQVKNGNVYYGYAYNKYQNPAYQSSISYDDPNKALADAQAWVGNNPFYYHNASWAHLGYTHNVSALKTGGYTGSWGPEGKLAFLHQKELVLNASDTDNMLRTVSLVRDIIQKIDIGASVLPIRPGLSLNALGETGSTFEQTVTIEANFPNVQDRYEIEAAFESLRNRASQFANRKKL